MMDRDKRLTGSKRGQTVRDSAFSFKYEMSLNLTLRSRSRILKRRKTFRQTVRGTPSERDNGV
jgi:hypothetical protein